MDTEERSPFFGIGMTSALFQEAGKDPNLIEALKTWVICVVRIFKTDLRVLLFMLRRADNLLGSIVLMTSKTSSSVNSVRDQEGSVWDCVWQDVLWELLLPVLCLSFFLLFFQVWIWLGPFVCCGEISNVNKVIIYVVSCF